MEICVDTDHRAFYRCGHCSLVICVHQAIGNVNYQHMKLYPFVFLLVCSCATAQQTPKNFPQFYKEGHRGTRGLMPENTIPSMIAAIGNGANMIEVDVYTSKDGQVFITHDPFV